MPFLCPENAPQKYKWLQCVRLVINKRRPSAAVAADAATAPSRFALGRRPSAHTFTNKSPLNRSIPSRKRERVPPRRTTKSAAGSGAVPADPLGIGYRFSPPRALSFCAFRFLTFPCFLFFRIMLFPSPNFAFSAGYGSIGLRGSQRSQNRC